MQRQVNKCSDKLFKSIFINSFGFNCRYVSCIPFAYFVCYCCEGHYYFYLDFNYFALFDISGLVFHIVAKLQILHLHF